MRDDKYLEMEREAYMRHIERRRTRRELRRRRETRNRIVALIVLLLVGIAVIWTVGAEGKEEQQTTPLTLCVASPENGELEEAVFVPELTSLGEFRITHYCACKACCGKDQGDPWYGITATGTTATEGRTIAVDPTVIPYGSKVAVFYDDGRICYYTAEDCGSAIKGNEIDVFIDSHERARELGFTGASVYIVNEVE